MEKNQNLIYQFQYLKERRNMFQDQLDFISASLGNLINTKNTIEKLKDVKEGEEILVPIGGIINLRAIIKNPEKCLLYISHDVVIEKELESSIDFIEKIIGQHNEQIQFLREQIQKLDLNLQNISQDLVRSNPKQYN
ncbi:MAG: prefoldin subunit alpha [Promethearchaeota archaeon]